MSYISEFIVFAASESSLISGTSRFTSISYISSGSYPTEIVSVFLYTDPTYVSIVPISTLLFVVSKEAVASSDLLSDTLASVPSSTYSNSNSLRFSSFLHPDSDAITKTKQSNKYLYFFIISPFMIITPSGYQVQSFQAVIRQVYKPCNHQCFLQLQFQIRCRKIPS